MPNLSRRGASFSNRQQGSSRCISGHGKKLAAIAAVATSVAGLGHWAVAADTLIFDAGGTATSSSTTVDGPGTWDTSTTDFYDATVGGPSDSIWASGDNAVFGGGSSGTAGSIAIAGTQSFNTLTFANPFAGSYTLSGGTLAVGASGSIIDSLTTATNTAVVAGTVTFGTGATLSGAGTGTVSLAGTLTGSVTITGGNFAFTNTPSGTTQLSGGTLDLAATNQPGSGKLQLVGGTSSTLNLGGVNISGTTVSASKSYGPLAYTAGTSGGIATISIQNGVLYDGADLSPQSSTDGSPTVFNLGASGGWGENYNGPDYVNGITGSGYLFSSSGSSVRVINLTPAAGAIYTSAAQSSSSTPASSADISLLMNGPGTQIFTGDFYQKSNAGITVTQGNLVLAPATGSDGQSAATVVNGGTLFLSNGGVVIGGTTNTLSQAVTVNSGGNLSDDTTAYDAATLGSGATAQPGLNLSAPAGASTAALVTINSGGAITGVNGAEFLASQITLNSGAIIDADLPGTGGTPSTTTPFISTRNSNLTSHNTISSAAGSIIIQPVSNDTAAHSLTTGTYHVFTVYNTAVSSVFSSFAISTANLPNYVFQLVNDTGYTGNTYGAIDLTVQNHSLASFTSANNTPDSNTGATAPTTAITADTINLGSFNVGDGGGSESFSLGHILANIGVSAVGMELSSVTPGAGNVENIGYTPALFTGSSSLAAGAIETAGGVATQDTSNAGTFSNTFTLNLEDNQTAGPTGLNAVGSETLTLTLDGSVASNTPEPGTFGLLSVSAMAALGRRRRRASSPMRTM